MKVAVVFIPASLSLGSFFLFVVNVLNVNVKERIPCQIVDAQKTIGELHMIDLYVVVDENNSTSSTSSLVQVDFLCNCGSSVRGNPRTCEIKCLNTELKYYRDRVGQTTMCDKHDHTISKILSTPELFLTEKPWEISETSFVFLAISLSFSAFIVVEFMERKRV